MCGGGWVDGAPAATQAKKGSITSSFSYLPQSLRVHAEGKKHKESLQKHLSDMRKRTLDSQREEQETNSEMARIERLANEAYKDDVQKGLAAAQARQAPQQGHREYRPPGQHPSGAPGAPQDVLQYYNQAYGHVGLPPEYAAAAARQAQEEQARLFAEQQARLAKEAEEKAKADAILVEMAASLAEGEKAAAAAAGAVPPGLPPPPGMSAPPGMTRRAAAAPAVDDETMAMMKAIQQKVLALQKEKDAPAAPAQAAAAADEPAAKKVKVEDGSSSRSSAEKKPETEPEPEPEPEVVIDEDTGLGTWTTVAVKPEKPAERKDGEMILTPFGQIKFKAERKTGVGAKGDAGEEDDSDDEISGDYGNLNDITIVKKKGANEIAREEAKDALREVDPSISFKIKNKKRKRERNVRGPKKSLKDQ